MFGITFIWNSRADKERLLIKIGRKLNLEFTVYNNVTIGRLSEEVIEYLRGFLIPCYMKICWPLVCIRWLLKYLYF